MKSDQIFSIFHCPRCKNVLNIESKTCAKCGIDIEGLKQNCAKCGSVYLLGKRSCSKCNAPLINESMGMSFNEVGIVYFNLRESEHLLKAEVYFKNSNYVESFIELQKEENLDQIVKLFKKDVNWIRECLLHVTKENNSFVNRVIDLCDRIFNKEESNKFQTEIFENLLKIAKEEGNFRAQTKYYHYLYRLTKNDDYRKKLKDAYYKHKGKSRIFLFASAFKLIIYGFFSACLFDALFIVLFGYKFPLKHSTIEPSAVTTISTWRFIPLFFFIGLSISSSYWFAFNQYFSYRTKMKFMVSLIMMTLAFLVAGACWGEIANGKDRVFPMIFILSILLFIIYQIRGIQGLFERSWQRIFWPFLTLFLLFLAIIPGKLSIPLYRQSSQIDFIGISFFSFSFILLQAIFLILINRNTKPHNSKVK